MTLSGWIGSMLVGSPFSGLFTRFEIGEIRISSAGKVTKGQEVMWSRFI